jgi:hypothetical protein
MVALLFTPFTELLAVVIIGAEGEWINADKPDGLLRTETGSCLAYFCLLRNKKGSGLFAILSLIILLLKIFGVIFLFAVSPD